MITIYTLKEKHGTIGKTKMKVFQYFEQKWTGGGEGLNICLRSLFLKKNLEISKMKFYSYSPVFPIDYNKCEILNKSSWKILIFSSINEWFAIAFARRFYFAQPVVPFSALCIFSKNGYLLIGYRCVFVISS